MEAVASSVSPSIISHRSSCRLQRSTRQLHHHHHRPRSLLVVQLGTKNPFPPSSSSPLFSPPLDNLTKKRWRASARREDRDQFDEDAAKPSEKDDDDVEIERALGMDGNIPRTSDEFVRRVSSRAYDIRRHLNQTLDSISYDVLESNPWRDDSKPVYVLTHKDNQLCTMKTRQNRSEVERELGLLFSKGGKRGLGIGNKAKQSRTGTSFNMFVEDIREGVLVFEDEDDATKYCDLLEGGGQGCEGIAELEASSVFDICHRMRALAVLFRRGTTPPLPESLEQNLRARKRSLEDQDTA